ncbi:MAG TPA: hypothetical protein VNW04_21735 [Puia sp.]|nr:hypothetical protein [Puia sp.]
MKNKLTVFLLKVLLYALPVVIGFEALFRLGFYPQITNSLLFDYKMIQVQKKHLGKVKVFAIGSSCGLYDLSSSLMARNFDDSFYNFSSWNLQVSDIRLLLPTLVGRYRPEYVLLCSSPSDFRLPPNQTYENYASMPSFIRDHFPEAFYLKPFTSVHQLFYRKWKSYRPPMDPWGGAPQTVPKERIHRELWDEYFLFPTLSTAEAYNDLDTLSAWLREKRIPLIFAEMPINLYYQNAPEARQLLAEHLEKCRAIVTSHGGIFLNYHDPSIFPDSLFFDQTHLQAAGGRLMTTLLLTDLDSIIKR